MKLLAKTVQIRTRVACKGTASLVKLVIKKAPQEPKMKKDMLGRVATSCE